MLVCIPLLLSLSLVIAVWIYRHSKIGNFSENRFSVTDGDPGGCGGFAVADLIR